MVESNKSDLAVTGGISVLVVSPYSEDHRSLANIFSHTNWTMVSAENCAEASRILSAAPVPVAICEYLLGERSWREINAHVQDLNSNTRVVVASRQADDRMWAEILNEGGYDCLVKPFEKNEVLRLVSLAWQSWIATTRMKMRVARAGTAAASFAC